MPKQAVKRHIRIIEHSWEARIRKPQNRISLDKHSKLQITRIIYPNTQFTNSTSIYSLDSHEHWQMADRKMDMVALSTDNLRSGINKAYGCRNKGWLLIYYWVLQLVWIFDLDWFFNLKTEMTIFKCLTKTSLAQIYCLS